MSIDRKDVEHIAALARLDLTEAEAAAFAVQLADILRYMETLNELDTSGVQPTSHAIHLTNRFREDEVRPSLPVDDVLALAPAVEDGQVLVPKVLGGEESL
ncbi:Asp-tRNA(Asn)/Glu-tRNA(Gln) amidotransferase subunit GatC [bacterium]|nr:Asp-tRNA(Asn)/Glu-tRNA(Gln) amidotransferase subunit GatC [candidate division CSSED10-310 bacterium]